MFGVRTSDCSMFGLFAQKELFSLVRCSDSSFKMNRSDSAVWVERPLFARTLEQRTPTVRWPLQAGFDVPRRIFFSSGNSVLMYVKTNWRIKRFKPWPWNSGLILNACSTKTVSLPELHDGHNLNFWVVFGLSASKWLQFYHIPIPGQTEEAYNKI